MSKQKDNNATATKPDGEKDKPKGAIDCTPKIIKGDTRLLLIAPHGYPDGTPPENNEDDDYTGHITEEVAGLLKCSAVINYSLSKEKENGDLNKISQAMQHTKYISAIEKVIKTRGKTLVIWIHGIDDKNIKTEAMNISTDFCGKPENLHALIGYGQGPNPDGSANKKKGKDAVSRYTAETKTADKIKTLLTENGLNTVFTRDNAENYRARSPKRMNQWFLQKGYDFSKIESIQIEIKKKGFREKETISKTAEILFDAFYEYFNRSMPVKKDINIEKKPNKALVNKAFKKITELAVSNKDSAMLDAGNYIIKEFFNNNFVFARIKAPTKKLSLNELKKKVLGDKNKPPEQTWFYDSSKLAIDARRYRNNFAYGKLNHSHKVRLLRVKDRETKDQLINEIIKKQPTVAQLDKMISEKNNFTEPLLSLENPPTIKELQQTDLKTLELSALQASELSKYHRKQSEIYTRAQKKLTSALKDRKAISDNKSQGNTKVSGFQDWTKRGNNVNICTGCSNDCIYCYNKPMAFKFGWAKKGHWKDEIIREKDVEAPQKLYNGRVGFPSSHDITETNVDACLTVLGKLLKAGNEILIVSKPNFKCIKKICDACVFFKNEILFRFTIGATDDKILEIWEPNAPSYSDRKRSLEYASQKGFKTSVSVEPMLDSPNINKLVDDLMPFVNDAIWIGKMNHLGWIKKNAGDELKKEIQRIEANQTDEKIKAVYDLFKDNPKIKWKDSIKKVVGLEGPPVAGMDV